MKIIKRIENILLILSVIVLVLAGILSVVLDESEGIGGLATLFGPQFLLVACLFIGIFFYFLENKNLSRLGFALMSATNVYVLIASLLPLIIASNLESEEYGVSFVISLIGTICFFVAFVLDITHIILNVIYNKNVKANSIDELNNKLVLLEKWKKLFDDKMISEEEFEIKRKELLEINE